MNLLQKFNGKFRKISPVKDTYIMTALNRFNMTLQKGIAMSHDEAVEKILTRLLHQPVSEEELNAAKSHLAGCRQCRDETNDLVSVLRGKPATVSAEAEGLIACSEIKRRLPDFVSGILDPAHPDFLCIERHINTCQNCFAEKELLAGLIADARDELAREIPGRPFGVELATGPAAVPLWERIKSGAKVFRHEIHILIEENVARFAELPGLKLAEILAPTPAPVLATRSLRRGDDGGEQKTTPHPVFQLLEIADETAGILMTLKIIADTAMEVKLAKLDGLREIESATVKLVEKWTGQLVDSQSTNHEGKAILRGMVFIPANEYVIQIKHAGGAWEIALSGKSLMRKKF